MRVALVLQEVWTGLRRNMSMAVAVVLVTFISLTFVGAAALLQMQIQQMKGFWYDRAQVAVYFCNDLDQSETCSQAAATEEQIAAVEDRDAAYARFLDQFGGTTTAEFAQPESMNEALWVSPVTPQDADVILEATSGLPGVLEARDQRALLDPIFSVLNTASLGAVGIAVLMLVAAVLLIATTIRLSAFSRRRELGIMRLVGASNRFIQTPFILEGVIAALVGSLLAAGAIVGIVQGVLQGYVADTLRTVAIVSLDEALVVAPALVVFGVGFAGLAAAVAIRRYLKV